MAEVIQEGEFKEGYLHGYAREINLGGTIFEGQFLMGDKSGKGVEINARGKITKGYWKNNEYQQNLSLQMNSL